MKNIFFVFCLLSIVYANAQECEPCGERTLVNFQEIEWLGIQKPEDSVMLNEWNKLNDNDLWYLIDQRIQQFFLEGSCLYIKTTSNNPQRSAGAKNNKYTIYGTIIHASQDYVLRLFMHPACSNEVIAETEVRFQMYPFFDIDKIATQAANQLVPQLLNVHDYEMRQRDTKNFGLGGDLSGGNIEITIDKKLVKGEETTVRMLVADCDGFILKNKEISTAGTSGGIFTPAKFNTGADGIAIVKFKMLTDKVAVINAACETKNVQGCQDLYTGSEVVKGIGGMPVKVSIEYDQFETRTMKRATLPGIEIKGGEEAERIDMEHRTVLYYFPSKKNLEEGFLIDTDKEGYYIGLTEKQPDPDAKTIFATESGWFFFSKSVQNTQISAMVGNVEMVKAEEDGQEIQFTGVAGLQHPSEVVFHLGNQNEPPSFMWHVEYPASDGNIAGGGAIIVKGEEGVKWEVNKIKDPKSIYKTEYLFSLTLNAAEELKKGDQALKDLFGFKLEALTKALDPTKPSQNPASASGSQTITVKILSPYEDMSYKPKK